MEATVRLLEDSKGSPYAMPLGFGSLKCPTWPMPRVAPFVANSRPSTAELLGELLPQHRMLEEDNQTSSRPLFDSHKLSVQYSAGFLISS